jgi:hypothetical protein
MGKSLTFLQCGIYLPALLYPVSLQALKEIKPPALKDASVILFVRKENGRVAQQVGWRRGFLLFCPVVRMPGGPASATLGDGERLEN